jgi:hypothetical protein
MNFMEFARDFAKKHKMTIKDAMRDPKARKAYDKMKDVKPGKKGAASKSKPGEMDDTTKKGGMRKTARKAYMK